MKTVVVIDMILAGLANLALLQQVVANAQAEGRTDLNDAEIDVVRGRAMHEHVNLGEAIAAAPDSAG